MHIELDLAYTSTELSMSRTLNEGLKGLRADSKPENRPWELGAGDHLGMRYRQYDSQALSCEIHVVEFKYFDFLMK